MAQKVKIPVTNTAKSKPEKLWRIPSAKTVKSLPVTPSPVLQKST
jgi:hypothetical protein